LASGGAMASHELSISILPPTKSSCTDVASGLDLLVNNLHHIIQYVKIEP